MSKLVITSMVSGKVVSFDAYITDMAQTFASTWNQEDVFGRNDPLATFQGTKRTISIALDVPAANLKEAKANLNQCGKLSTFLYPGLNMVSGGKEAAEELKEGKSLTLDSVATFQARPPLVKVKFANLIRSMANESEGLMGFIDSYSFTPNMDAGMFTEGRNHYPRVISITFSFTALHQVELGYGRSETVTRKKGELKTKLGTVKWAGKKLPFE